MWNLWQDDLLFLVFIKTDEPMGYNWQQRKMKKNILTMALLIMGIVCSLMLSSFTKNESSQNNESSDSYMAAGDDCRFEATNAKPSISGTTVTITVTVRPAFTPSEKGSYRVVVRPRGPLANILDSQAQEIYFQYDRGWGPNHKSHTVEFHCSVNDNTYNQCNSNAFDCTCFKE